MPDMPQPAPGGAPPASAPPAGAPAPGGGAGFTEAITQCDALLSKISSAVAQSKITDDVKSLGQAALAAFRQFENALLQAAGGEGGEPEPDGDEGGPTTMEQGGAKGAMPMSHQNMRG